jgi:hypothetical protein
MVKRTTSLVLKILWSYVEGKGNVAHIMAAIECDHTKNMSKGERLVRASPVSRPKRKHQKSICDADKSIYNVDTYSSHTAGVGFSKLCSRDIPLPPLPAIPNKKSRRQENLTSPTVAAADCPKDDSVPFDDANLEE